VEEADGSSRGDESVGPVQARGKAAGKNRDLKWARRQITKKGRKLVRMWTSLVGGDDDRVEGIRAENIVWIFGTGRTGSTWLAAMMGEMEGHTVWFEPRVGALFDPRHLELEFRKNKHFIMAPRYRNTWLRSIRSFVLDGARARFPGATEDGYLVVKEPGGSMGAPLLMEALPESRMILLVRDPRDVAASWLDAARKGGWQNERKKGTTQDIGSSVDEDPNAFVELFANRYLLDVNSSKEAYDAHEGYKVLVRYEELRADALGTMRRVYTALGMPVDEGELSRAVEKHSWENIPEEEKGEGKFYRKAAPEAWREDLTPEQAGTVERITAPLLRELYPDGAS
jgi:hypothetical protein